MNEPIGPMPDDVFAALQHQLKKQPSNTTALLHMQLAQQAKQFSRAEAAVPEASTVTAGEQYLTFSLYDYTFGVKADTVQGVERLANLTPVPNVASWVKGVMNLRGSIISVVDLRSFLGLESVPHDVRTRLLSLQCNEMVITFIVDGISEMLAIPPEAMGNMQQRQASIPTWIAPYAAGIALLEGRAIVLLNVLKLLFSEKMHRYAV
jgi:purine-binding chemotaxis protein CheW